MIFGGATPWRRLWLSIRGVVLSSSNPLLIDESGGRCGIRSCSGIFLHHGLQPQAMIPLKHSWIEIEKHIHEICHNSKTDVPGRSQGERHGKDARKRKYVRRLGYSRVVFKLCQSASRPVEEMFPAIPRIPKRDPHDFAEQFDVQDIAHGRE